MSFTIFSAKEGQSPAKPLFLVTVIAPDGDTVYLTTGASIGNSYLTYNGNNYLTRITNNELMPIQINSPQGYDSVPGFTLSLADADLELWSNHCIPHGWRGATVTLTVILWDIPTNAYSTDAFQWTFIGGNPQHEHASGKTTLDVQSSTNFTRLKIPSVPYEYRCPWDFPSTYLQRVAALNDPTSIYYQDGYSADVPGGVGNLIAKTTLGANLGAGATSVTVSSGAGFPTAFPFQATCDGEEFYVTAGSGTSWTITRGNDGTADVSHLSGATFYVPFTTCDLTRSSPNDASVGCMARLGNASTTSVAPDGDLTHDIAGNYTARFGGFTFIVPTSYSGRQYVSGQKLFGFNQPNTSIIGTYINMVYGTQWVPGIVIDPAGDPNSLRSEVVLAIAAFGPMTVSQVVVNGVLVPYSYDDQLFTWRFNSQPGTPLLISSGGRSGALSGDAYYSTSSYSGLGDPHGSMCVIEFVVPYELAAPGSIPSVQALVTSGPILNCYPIATATASGGEITITFTTGTVNANLGSTMQCRITGNSWAAANGTFTVDIATYGPPGTITLLGTAATGSGTGGGVFFYHAPNLTDNGYCISTQDSVQNSAAANAVWVTMDLMSWGNITVSQIDAVSWYAAAQIAAIAISYTGADGNTYTHAQFKCNLLLPGNQRQTLGSVINSVRNAANLMIGPNSITGLIQCFVKQTLADQQPAPITGSNYNTAVSSITAAGVFANGYYAYLFDETVILPGTFKITSTKIEATPNTVAFPFQDEYNSYQTDSLTEIDPVSYIYSGDQEIVVPIPINGIPNFDQGTRIANVQLAEALYGNPRNDAGGTIYCEFACNQRVLHLTGRLGYIVGIVFQELLQLPLGLGTTPLPFRITSLTPDTDGEKWQVKCAWHNDEWYTYAYGQNPTPYQQNPLAAPPQRPPYPWRPGQTVWGSGDALFPNLLGFTFWIDLTQSPAQLNISGAVSANAQTSTLAPVVPLQGSTASTGGTLTAGSYFIAFSTNGLLGPVSGFTQITVPVGTTTNTITVSGLQWRSGAAPSIQPFIGNSVMNMRACAGGTYTGSSNDSNGNPTVYTFTAWTADGLGLPDINFSNFLVQETGIAHGGVWGDTIQSVTNSGLTLNFPEASYSSNQWAGYTLSLYFRPGVVDQPGLNMVVTSSTTTTLVMPSTGFLAGDVVVMRPMATTVTSNSITEPNWSNYYNSNTGLTVNGEVGNLLLIIAGTGSGYPPYTIKSNTATKITIQGEFYVDPDSTSVYIVMYPTVQQTYPTQTFSGNGSALAPIATTPANTTAYVQSLLVQVAAADANGNISPMQYQPFREVYIPSLTDTTTISN